MSPRPVDRTAVTDEIRAVPAAATVPLVSGVPTPRMPMPAIPTPAAAAGPAAPRRTYRDPLLAVPAPDRDAVRRVAQVVDRYLDALVDPADILTTCLAVAWPAFPPHVPIPGPLGDTAWAVSRAWRRSLARTLAPHLTDLQVLVRPWQAEAATPCARDPRCTAAEQCPWHTAWNYAWSDHLIPRVHALLSQVPDAALAALTGARP